MQEFPYIFNIKRNLSLTNRIKSKKEEKVSKAEWMMNEFFLGQRGGYFISLST